MKKFKEYLKLKELDTSRLAGGQHDDMPSDMGGVDYNPDTSSGARHSDDDYGQGGYEVHFQSGYGTGTKHFPSKEKAVELVNAIRAKDPHAKVWIYDQETGKVVVRPD